MSARRGGLGKGLGALIPTGPRVEPVSEQASPAPGLEQTTSTAVLERTDLQHPADTQAESAAVVPAPAPHVEAPTESEPPQADQPTESTPPVVDSSVASPQVLNAVPGASFREIPVDAITPNPHQPRQVFDEESLDELKTSIKEFGLLQPVVVREIQPDSFELVMGERRWRAAREIGLTVIPAIVRNTADDAMLRDALLENIHRTQLNPLEEAAAYQQLLQEFDTTHEELASRIGRSRSQVTNTIRLLNLPLPVQRRVAAGVLTAGHARALLSLEDAEAQEEIAARIVAEGLSVRATEELVTLASRETPKANRTARSPKVTAPGLNELATRLSDAFDTTVKVELGRRKGKIVVEFASVDDLERIVSLIHPNSVPHRGK